MSVSKNDNAKTEIALWNQATRFENIPGEPPLIEAWSLRQFVEYKPPYGYELVGDRHIVKGGQVFVIGGPPGVGKSRTASALAVAGARNTEWMGYVTHRQFRTLIVQNENGLLRLKDEICNIPDWEELNEFIRITPPPRLGFRFEDEEFRQELGTQISDFKPDLVIVDPWTAVVHDMGQKDYLEAFNFIREIIPAIDSSPAVGIIAHTRKPYQNERKVGGRALLPMLAGSYVLTSVPRCVFIIQHASDDVMEEKIILTCVKNNDGRLGPPTAWTPGNGLFAAAPNVDLNQFRGGKTETKKITAESLSKAFAEFHKEWVLRGDIINKLTNDYGFAQTTCYNALHPVDGYLRENLEYRGKVKKTELKWVGLAGDFTTLVTN